jgi:IS5 family transposase
MLLKQQFHISYEQLSFHLSDSMTDRAFARLPCNLSPSRSCLQSTIRSIKPETLEKTHIMLSANWLKKGDISLEKLRVDSTVVNRHIAPPSDNQLLNDGFCQGFTLHVSEQVLVFLTGSYYNVPWSDSLY